LIYVNLDTNSFSGTVPSELGSLTALTYLNLHTSSFSGNVPSELVALTALDDLDLSGNSLLNGTVPAKLCNNDGVTIVVDCNPGPQCSCCTCDTPTR
jgi:hypothetical protein